MQRREFLASGLALQSGGADAIVVDPAPRFEISPWLYMQFMEPLGVTDSSVEAAWDYETDDWRKDFIAASIDLAPQVVRWGGLYSRYYRWREGVGPADKRPWMRNYVWGGKETNRVGTAEFVDFCQRVSAEPLMCVNFLSDGEARYRERGRTGDAAEAADWVSYCNSNNMPIRLWQLGNETSYGRATFSRDQAIAHTIEFARAMKERDPKIVLIGWGDRGRDGYWAPEMVKRAGGWLDMIAFHMMGQSPQRKDTVLRPGRYWKDPQRAWEELLELADRLEKRLTEMEQSAGSMPVAITEGHLSLPPHNANPLLLEWLSAAYHARSLNIYQRHGARVRMATIADFEGNRWTVNAMMLQVPGGISYLTPAGSIARLFRRHQGTHHVDASAPAGLDVAASVTGRKVWLHVANLNYQAAVTARLEVAGRRVTGGRAFEIAPEDPRTGVSVLEPEIFRPVEKALGGDLRWRFPAGSVSAVELEIAENVPK